MNRSVLQLGGLFLAIIILASFSPRHLVKTPSLKTPSLKTIRVKSFSCPTASDFHFQTVDFGWSGGSCYSQHIVEVYLVFHGSSFTDPVDIEFEVTDENASGTSTYTFWQTIYPGNPRTYIGQNQETWTDMNCDGNQDPGEMEYHTYSMTGNSHC